MVTNNREGRTNTCNNDDDVQDNKWTLKNKMLGQAKDIQMDKEH